MVKKARATTSGVMIGIIAIGALLFLVITALLLFEQPHLLKTAEPQSTDSSYFPSPTRWWTGVAGWITNNPLLSFFFGGLQSEKPPPQPKDPPDTTGSVLDWSESNLPDADLAVATAVEEQVCPFGPPPAVGGIRSDSPKLAQIPVCFYGAEAPEPNDHILKITLKENPHDPTYPCKQKKGTDCSMEELIELVCGTSKFSGEIAPDDCKTGSSGCIKYKEFANLRAYLQGIVEPFIRVDPSTRKEEIFYRFPNPAKIIVNKAPLLVPAVYPVAPGYDFGQTGETETIPTELLLDVHYWSLSSRWEDMNPQTQGFIADVQAASLSYAWGHYQIIQFFGTYFKKILNNPPVPARSEYFGSPKGAGNRAEELWKLQYDRLRKMIRDCRNAFDEKIVKIKGVNIPGYPESKKCPYDPDHRKYIQELVLLLTGDCSRYIGELDLLVGPIRPPNPAPRLPSTPQETSEAIPPAGDTYFPAPRIDTDATTFPKFRFLPF